jgi:O-antigen/teichoic acid export membrane protein
VTEVRAEDALRAEDDGRTDDEVPRRLGIGALAQDTVIYGGTRVVLKSLAFLLVPLYAHYLTPAEFGILELILATAALVDVFINLPGTLARFYFDRDDRQWRRRVITTFLAIEASYPAVLIGALIIFSDRLADGVLGSTTYAAFFVIALCDVYLTNVVDVPMSLCRLRRKPLTFAFYSLTRGLTQIVLSVLLVAVWHFGVKGILIASLVSVCVAFVLTSREYIHDLTRRFESGLLRDMLAFAWPTVLTALAFYTLTLVDRFFVSAFHGKEATGLYGVAFRYAQVVAVGVFAFRMGWPQWHFSWLHSGRHPEMVARGATHYFFGIGALAVLVSLWIRPLFLLIMPDRYLDATLAVPPLALAGVAAGAFTVFAVGFNVTKRMRLLSVIAVVGAAAAIGLYFLLVPPFSYVGAAWGTAAAMGILALMAGVAGQRIYPVPWDARRIGLALGLTLALALAALALDAWVGAAVSLPLRVALTLAYPLVLVSLGYFTRDELAKARAAIGSLRRRTA